VEFWHDDPLQDLPDKPQLCPDALGAEIVTRVYDSPSRAASTLFCSKTVNPSYPMGTPIVCGAS